MNSIQRFGAAAALVLIVIATTLHNPFGGYRVDDGLYSRVEFLRLFREAYPEYADYSDSDLVQKVLARYPAAKTWIREETDGTSPLPIAITEQETNSRLHPPPGYFGARPRRRSINAVFPWIDETSEYFGFVGPVLAGAGFWIWLFRRSRVV
ncbi:MAG: hypothetical protein WCP28_19390 [Actinomycetes bacterium]